MTTTNVIYSIALQFINAEFVTLQEYLLLLSFSFPWVGGLLFP